MIAAARNLVTHFRKSPKASAALKRKQIQLQEEVHNLIADVSTRWNSTCELLDRVVEQRWPVVAVLSDPSITKKKDQNLDLTTDQWKLAEEVVGVLKPLITLTEQFSLETNVSLSATIPMLSNLKKRVMMPNPDDSPAIRDLKKAITTDIDTR